MPDDAALTDHGLIEEDVSLLELAYVQTMTSEGVELVDALVHVGVPPASWEAGERAWGERLARASREDEALLDAHAEKISAVTRAMHRPVPPLDEDATRWIGFLRAWGAGSDPIGALDALGLTTGDLFRLQDLWIARSKEEAVRKQLEEAIAAPVPARIEVHPGARVLPPPPPPRPRSARPIAPPPQAPPPPPPRPSLDEPLPSDDEPA